MFTTFDSSFGLNITNCILSQLASPHRCLYKSNPAFQSWFFCLYTNFRFIPCMSSLLQCILHDPLNDPKQEPGEFVHTLHSITHCISQDLIKKQTNKQKKPLGMKKICIYIGIWPWELWELAVPLHLVLSLEQENCGKPHRSWRGPRPAVARAISEWASKAVTMCLSCNGAQWPHWYFQHKKNIAAILLLPSKSHTKCFALFMPTWNSSEKGILRNAGPDQLTWHITISN